MADRVQTSDINNSADVRKCKEFINLFKVTKRAVYLNPSEGKDRN